MLKAVNQLWPEISMDPGLQTPRAGGANWTKALERSPLKPDDLNKIPSRC